MSMYKKLLISSIFVLIIIFSFFISSPTFALTMLGCSANEGKNYECGTSTNGQLDISCGCYSSGWSPTVKEVTVNIESGLDPSLGESTNLVWSSTNATSCTASGDWSGSKALSGNQYVGPLNSFKTYAYTITCKNSGYSKSATAYVVVDSYQEPESCSATASLAPNKAKVEAWDPHSGSEGYAIYRDNNDNNFTYIGDVTGPSGIGAFSYTDYNIGSGWHKYKIVAHESGQANVHVSAPCITSAVRVPLPAPTLSLSANPLTLSTNSTKPLSVNVTSSNISGSVTYPRIYKPIEIIRIEQDFTETNNLSDIFNVTAGSTPGTYSVEIYGRARGTDGTTINATPYPLIISVTVTGPTLPPSGTLTAGDCAIDLNASSCNSLLTWTVKDLVAGKATSVTKNMPGANTAVFNDASYDGSENLSRTNFASPISYGTTGFDLYHNNGPLAYDSAVATCASGSWDGTKCSKIAKADGACSSPASHYNCTFGSSTKNINTPDSWTWDCEGSGGGITARCSEIKKPDLIAGSTTPATVTVGIPTSFSANITNSGTASTEMPFPYFFQKASSVNGSGILSDLSSGATNPLASGATKTVSSSITFASTGVYSVRLCVDKTGSSSNGTIAESNESNNCGSWTNVTVTDAPVNGACSSPATHYSCLKGKSVNNKSVPTSWTWDCDGTNGGQKVSCEEKKIMSGTMVANPASCLIQKGDSACSVNLSWNTVYPEGVTSVTSSYPSPNTVVATGNAGTVGGSGGSSVSIPYNSRTFYLYNNSKSLVPTSPNGTGLTVKSECVSGTAWNSNSKKCLPIATPISVSISANPQSMTLPSNSTSLSWDTTGSPTSCIASGDWSGIKATPGGSENKTGLVAGSYTYTITCSKSEVPDTTNSVTVIVNPAAAIMSGSLNVGSCNISAGNNSCNATLTWSVTNPQSTTSVTSSWPSPNTEVATGHSGSTTVTIPYNYRDLFLYNNMIELDNVRGFSDCASGASWNGSSCRSLPPPEPTATISIDPSSVASGGSVTVSWSSNSSCTGTNFDTGGASSGSVVVNPTSNTTYSVVCDNGAAQASSSATVTITSTGKKPIFQED